MQHHIPEEWIPQACLSYTCISFISYSGSVNEIDNIGIRCLFSFTLQPKSARIAGAFSASIFMVSAAENPENLDSSPNQNSLYLLIGTIPYSRKIICYGWCAIGRCHGQSGIKGSYCQDKDPVFGPDEEMYWMVTEWRRWTWQLICSGYSGKANTLARIKWRLAGLSVVTYICVRCLSCLNFRFCKYEEYRAPNIVKSWCTAVWPLSQIIW